MLVRVKWLSKRFWHDTRAAVMVELVVSLPILVAVLAFATQYGFAMQVRNALDVAVRDTARYLARAPLDDGTGAVPQIFITNAQALVAARFKGNVESLTYNTMTADSTGSEVSIAVTVSFPLMKFLNADSTTTNLTMTASDSWPRTE